MRFVDLLRTTVLLSAAAATALAMVTAIVATGERDATLMGVACGWWLVAALVGARLGRRAEVNPPIGRLLAEARAATSLPEIRPAATMVNRLWPLLLVTLVAAGVAAFVPQVPAVTTGFAVIWALAWRRQDGAVRAIEQRDGVEFLLERTSPLQPIRLVRVPGLRRDTVPSPAA